MAASQASRSFGFGVRVGVVEQVHRSNEKLLFALGLVLASALVTEAQEPGKHLFILSGQSNMQGHRPDEAFTPAVEQALGKDRVIVIQDALGGQPIQRWYKDWESPNDTRPETRAGDLYERLMNKVQPAIKGSSLDSVTFIWMQGERDAKMQWSAAYEESLLGLYRQVCKDVGRDDVGFVIGRLSDFDLDNARYPHWTKIRQIQEQVAQANPRFVLVNTDDLNDGVNRRGKEIKNDLHYSAAGYRTLGKRFAESALGLIETN